MPCLYHEAWSERLSLRLVRFRLLPSGDKFFELFNKASANAAQCAQEISKLVNDSSNSEAQFTAIKAIEQSSDEVTDEILHELDTSFITPYDREDIHALAEALDDVVDEMYGFSHLYNLMRPEPVIPELLSMTDCLVSMTQCLADLTQQIKSQKAVKQILTDIGKLERDGDETYRQTMARLFGGEFEALDVLKWKDLVQALEASLNKIEDVSDVVESIVLKQS